MILVSHTRQAYSLFVKALILYYVIYDPSIMYPDKLILFLLKPLCYFNVAGASSEGSRDTRFRVLGF